MCDVIDELISGWCFISCGSDISYQTAHACRLLSSQSFYPLGVVSPFSVYKPCFCLFLLYRSVVVGRIKTRRTVVLLKEMRSWFTMSVYINCILIIYIRRIVLVELKNYRLLLYGCFQKFSCILNWILASLIHLLKSHVYNRSFDITA